MVTDNDKIDSNHNRSNDNNDDCDENKNVRRCQKNWSTNKDTKNNICFNDVDDNDNDRVT